MRRYLNTDDLILPRGAGGRGRTLKRFAFILFSACHLMAAPKERLRLVHADELENITDENGKAVQYLTGNVKFTKGQATITSDRAYYSDRQGIGSFIQSVRVQKEQQTLTADSVRMDSRNDVVTAFGHVHFDDEQYKLTSDTLTYFMNADSGIASGSVHFVQKKQIITADHLTYKKEKSTETASYTAAGAVTIREEDREATCGKSIYDAEGDMSILLMDPVVVQQGQTLSGDEIRLYYRDETVERLIIPDRAHIVYRTRGKVPHEVEAGDSSLTRYEEQEFVDDMTGRRLEAYLLDGQLDSVRLEGMATTLYHLFSEESSGEDSVYQGQNIASGDTITLLFAPDSVDESDLEIIRIVGGARGEYRPDESSEDVDAPILYRADTIHYHLPSQQTLLRKDVQIDYKDTRLTSGFVEVTWEDNLLRALPAPEGQDSAEPNDTPTFFEKGRNPMTGESLLYNLSTGRGRVVHGRSQMSDGYYRGDRIRNRRNDVFLVDHSIYTTCDLDPNPHFYFESRQMKMITDDKIIAKPIVLYLSGIPIFGLPFGVFPDQGGKRHSGWIMPSYGENRHQGQYLKGLSYFWAVSDYWNSQFSLDFYDRQGIVFHNSNSYFKRYGFRGSLNYRYNRTVGTGEIADIFDRPGAVRWSVAWNHSQNMRHHQTFNVQARYYSDSQFNRRLGTHRDTRLDQKAISQATYSKQWPEQNFSISMNLSETRNLLARAKTHPSSPQDSIYYEPPVRAGLRVVESNTTLPILNLRKGSSQLFGSSTRGGPTFHWSYSSTVRNQGLTFYGSDSSLLAADGDSVTRTFVWGSRQTEFNNSWVHNISVSGSGRLLKFVAIRPSLSFREAWITKYFDADSADSLGKPVGKREIHGFLTRHTGAFSVSANTKLYGLFPVRLGPLTALRHTITPSIGFTFQPDYSKPLFGYDFGYFKHLKDPYGNEVLFDRFAGSQISSTSKSETRSMNIAVKNLFQAKVKINGQERKIDNLLTWNMRTSYNFAADRFKFAKLRSSFRAGWLRKLNLDFSTVHDFYDFERKDGKAVRVNRIAKNGWGVPVPRLVEMSAVTGFQLSGTRRGLSPQESVADTTAVDTAEGEVDLLSGGIERLDKEVAPVAPGRELWNLHVSLRYSSSRNDPFHPTDNFWMNTTLGLRLTRFWKIDYTARFDLLKKNLVSHDFHVYRNLHCWELNFTWTPTGFGRGFYLRINVKSPSLRDLKIESRGGRWLGPSIP